MQIRRHFFSLSYYYWSLLHPSPTLLIVFAVAVSRPGKCAFTCHTSHAYAYKHRMQTHKKSTAYLVAWLPAHSIYRGWGCVSASFLTSLFFLPTYLGRLGTQYTAQQQWDRKSGLRAYLPTYLIYCIVEWCEIPKGKRKRSKKELNKRKRKRKRKEQID